MSTQYLQLCFVFILVTPTTTVSIGVDMGINLALDLIMNTINDLQHTGDEQRLREELRNIANAIENLENSLANFVTANDLLAMNIRRGTKLELKLNDLENLQNLISLYDQRLQEYVNVREELEKGTLEDFAEWCLSHDPNALPGLLERIHFTIAPPHRMSSALLKEGLFQLLQQDLEKDGSDVCSLKMSPHQLIYDLYITLALTEIKAYAMMQFSWTVLRFGGLGNFTKEENLSKGRYERRTALSAMVASEVLAVASRTLYKCEPPKHKAGVTYTQVTRLIQAYIENEADLNNRRSCTSTCKDYKHAQRHGCYDENYCSHQTPCYGRIISCEYQEGYMSVCPAYQHTGRRYQWIKGYYGRNYGQINEYCSKGVKQAYSWRRGFVRCSYCMCLCDDSTNSDRYFSLREVLSDVENNKVITGIRLVKLGRVFHFQIHQGTLKKRGFVGAGEWVAVQTFDPDDYSVKNGVDFHTLDYDNRIVNLGQVDSPAGYILTGVGFREDGDGLYIQIRSSPFDFRTGKVSSTKWTWFRSQYQGSELQLHQPDIPTRSNTHLPVDSKGNQYVRFTHSDFTKDAGQSTVPFVDIQPILPNKGSTLISGVGLIHRGAKGSGGFIGVKLITYDYSRITKALPLAQVVLKPSDSLSDSLNKDRRPTMTS